MDLKLSNILQIPNLIYNGDFASYLDGFACWTISSSAVNTSTNGMIPLPSESVIISQSFNDEVVYDVVVRPPSVYTTWPGMESPTHRTIMPGVFTVSFSQNNRNSRVKITDVNDVDVVSGWSSAKNPVFVLTTTRIIANFSIETEPLDTNEGELGLVSMVGGEYKEVPYRGNPLSVLPRGAIVSVVGTVCPIGYAPVNYDKFIRSEQTPDTHSAGTLSAATSEGLPFETTDGALYAEYAFGQEHVGENPSTNTGIKNLIFSRLRPSSPVDPEGLHTHNTSEVEASASGLSLLFCKRI